MMNSMIAFNSNGAFNALYVMIGTIIFVIIFSVIDIKSKLITFQSSSPYPFLFLR